VVGQFDLKKSRPQGPATRKSSHPEINLPRQAAARANDDR
jgi:hypothetical protein